MRDGISGPEKGCGSHFFGAFNDIASATSFSSKRLLAKLIIKDSRPHPLSMSCLDDRELLLLI